MQQSQHASSHVSAKGSSGSAVSRPWSAQVRRGVDLQSLYALVYLVVANSYYFV